MAKIRLKEQPNDDLIFDVEFMLADHFRDALIRKGLLQQTSLAERKAIDAAMNQAIDEITDYLNNSSDQQMGFKITI